MVRESTDLVRQGEQRDRSICLRLRYHGFQFRDCEFLALASERCQACVESTLAADAVHEKSNHGEAYQPQANQDPFPPSALHLTSVYRIPIETVTMNPTTELLDRCSHSRAEWVHDRTHCRGFGTSAVSSLASQEEGLVSAETNAGAVR